MNILRFVILILILQIGKSDSIVSENEHICLCGGDIDKNHALVHQQIAINHEKEIRDQFKKKYPTPDNLQIIKKLWTLADKSFQDLMSAGYTADVVIVDKHDHTTVGKDIYIKANGVSQLREYRGKDQAITFDQKVCQNNITSANSIEEFIEDTDNVQVEYLPNAETKFDWVCTEEIDSVYYGLFKIDFDFAIKSSVEDITVDGEKLRVINLLVAEDFTSSPFEYNREYTLVIGKHDVRPRALKTRYTYDKFTVEYAQWNFDYDTPVKFIVLPNDRIKIE